MKDEEPVLKMKRNSESVKDIVKAVKQDKKRATKEEEKGSEHKKRKPRSEDEGIYSIKHY
jgi:hypothetical protein